MTIVEYRREYAQCELRFINDSNDTEAVTRQCQLLKECKARTLHTLHKYFTQLEHELMLEVTDQAKRKILIQVFNYYDNKHKYRAIIPKSIFKNNHILPHPPEATYYDIKDKEIPQFKKFITKQVPNELRESTNSSARGYEIPLQDLANILNLETAQNIEDRH